MTDFLRFDSFLAERECQLLMDYAKKNMAVLSKENAAKQFSGKVIHSSDMCQSIRDLLVNDIAVSIRDSLRDYYQDKHIYIESVMLNHWPTGMSLGDHADNAFADNGEPNYTSWRTHSAIIYLNDDFEGGLFYFRDGETIKPKQGLAIAFPGGLTHVHGVTEVTSGDRWTAPMWFSASPSKEELV